MWGGRLYASPLSIRVEVLRTLAAGLALVALVIDGAALWSFHQARTTINPLKPGSASHLVTSGVYRITRNPMYLGMATLLTAWACWLGTTWPFLGPVVFVLYITRFQIQPEEQALTKRFGEPYLAYRRHVRRWL
jgi:protein-S-isoprenylcysteine O-methyltransferase Ste14